MLLLEFINKTKPKIKLNTCLVGTKTFVMFNIILFI